MIKLLTFFLVEALAPCLLKLSVRAQYRAQTTRAGPIPGPNNQEETDEKCSNSECVGSRISHGMRLCGGIR
jgi:hypothetical protein